MALTELRRRRWRDVSLDGLLEGELHGAPPRQLASPASSPERVVEKAELLEQARRIVDEELTARQRLAMTAVALKGMPDQVAETVLREVDVARLMPLVQHHLETCADCREEWEQSHG